MRISPWDYSNDYFPEVDGKLALFPHLPHLPKNVCKCIYLCVWGSGVECTFNLHLTFQWQPEIQYLPEVQGSKT